MSDRRGYQLAKMRQRTIAADIAGALASGQDIVSLRDIGTMPRARAALLADAIRAAERADAIYDGIEQMPDGSYRAIFYAPLGRPQP